MTWNTIGLLLLALKKLPALAPAFPQYESFTFSIPPTHAAAMCTVMISPVKVSATVSVWLSCCGIASVADRTIKMSRATMGGIMLPRIEDVLPDDAIAAPVAKYIMSTCTPRKAAWPVMYAAMKNSAGASHLFTCKAHDTNGDRITESRQTYSKFSIS